VIDFDMSEFAREQFNPQYTDFKQAMASSRFSELKETTQSYIQGLAVQADELLVRLGVDRLEDYDERQVKTEEGGEQLLAELDLYIILFSRMLRSMEKDCVIREFEDSEGEIKIGMRNFVQQIIKTTDGFYCKHRSTPRRGENVETIIDEQGKEIISEKKTIKVLHKPDGELVYLTKEKVGAWKVVDEKGVLLREFWNMEEPEVYQGADYLYFVGGVRGEKVVIDESFSHFAAGVDVHINNGVVYSLHEHYGHKPGAFLLPEGVDLEGYVYETEPLPHFVDYNGEAVVAYQDEALDMLRVMSLKGELVALVDSLDPVSSVHDYVDGKKLVVTNDENMTTLYLASKDGSEVLSEFSGNVSQVIMKGEKYMLMMEEEDGSSYVATSDSERIEEGNGFRNLISFKDKIFVEKLGYDERYLYIDIYDDECDLPGYVESIFEVSGVNYAWMAIGADGPYVLYNSQTGKKVSDVQYEDMFANDDVQLKTDLHTYFIVCRASDNTWCLVNEELKEFGRSEDVFSARIAQDQLIEMISYQEIDEGEDDEGLSVPSGNIAVFSKYVEVD
jgi:hypothetical protein